MKPLTKTFNVEMFLKLIALIVVSFMFLKAIIDVDRSYDTWVYHLPFAGRMWGITPVEMYGFENHEEARFAGFPILAEWFQGLFWFVFGHVQAANLVSFLSLIIYFCFLKIYFQVPLYLSAIALLAIPLVQTHATTCYVDLPGNLCIAVLILTTYLLYTQNTFTQRNLWAIFISAACAANIKPQLVPLVFVILCFTVCRIISLYFYQNKSERLKLQVFLPVIFLASLIIFATPLKNTVVYGNPFYPVRIEIAGQVLNHTMGLYNASPDYLQEASKPQRWLYSILEINSPNWSVDQYSPDPSKTRMGGFFGAYVVFNVLLFGYLMIRTRHRETITAAVTVAVMSIVAANFPQSHELRYFMYWMLVLVSFNLYLVTHLKRIGKSIIEPKYIGIVAVFALAFVITKTEYFYVKPSLLTLERYVQQSTNPKVLEQINPGEQVCLVGKQPNTFLYAAKFHPQLLFYSIKAAGDAGNCGDRRVIL